MPAVVSCRVNSPGITSPYWMADPAIGGAILGEACHFVDLMYWLLESEPVEVAAFTLPTGATHPIGENNLVASFRFADGSVGSLTYCTIGSRTSGGERVEVFAEGIGVATEDFTRLDVRAGSRRTQSRWWPDKGYAELVDSFVQAVRHGTRAIGHRARWCPRYAGLSGNARICAHAFAAADRPPRAVVARGLTLPRDGVGSLTTGRTRHARRGSLHTKDSLWSVDLFRCGAQVNNLRWVSHCRDLVQLPVAA